MAASDKSQTPKEEIDQLKEQLDDLSAPAPAQPAASAATAAVSEKAAAVAGQAGEYAKQAYASANEGAERLADWTRDSPVMALGIACVAGYLLGRAVR